MRLKDYLSSKYKVSKPTIMLSCEARAFGIPYPLESGWLAKYGDREFTPDIAKTLTKSLTRLIENDAKNADSAKLSLKVIERAYLQLKTKPEANSVDFLQSKAWKRLRLEAFKIYGNLCQCCGASPSNGATLNVDHIKPRRLFPELALDLKNLQILCGDCNEGKGNWDMSDWRNKT
jgi:hypothetical protein